LAAKDPQCLPDIVEAYVGAMFIDADFDYSVVQQFFDEHVKPFFDDMEMYDSYANNHPVVRTITLSRVLFNY
jgi:endoribonuclease Dicer